MLIVILYSATTFQSNFRSLCSLVCKWNYSADPDGNNKWNEEFFDQIQLRDLKKDNWRKIGILVNVLYNVQLLTKHKSIILNESYFVRIV